MKLLKNILFLSIVFVFFLFPQTTYCQDYYVSNTGDDQNSGTSEEQPWQSVAKINEFKFLPGDTIHFKKGDVWREQIIPISGNESGYITYTSYGTGEKPLFLGSLDRSNPNYWKYEGNNIWSSNSLSDYSNERTLLSREKIYLWTQGGAVVKEQFIGTAFNYSYNLHSENSGSYANDIQLILKNLKIEKGKRYLLSFRAKSTINFTIPFIDLTERNFPWSDAYSYKSDWSPDIGQEWNTFNITYQAVRNDTNANITFFLGGDFPSGADLYIDSLSFIETDNPEVYTDVGNMILNNEQDFGIKVFEETDLTEQNQFWYDENNYKIKMYSVENPAETYDSIECALNRYIIQQSNKAYVVYDGLALKYGGSHGIGGKDTHHIQIKHCDVSYIGGGELYMRGKTVRFGNGIEFWGDAHDNLVEGCNIWEIYDAGLTNQSIYEDSKQYNITYKNNKIWNCEYSYEFWSSSADGNVYNIIFEDNICQNAGYGWGHNQRPDKTGRHICFWASEPTVKNIYIRNNTFDTAKESCFYLSIGWINTKGITLNNNSYIQPKDKVVVRWLYNNYYVDNLNKYLQDTGKDYGSNFSYSY